MARITLTTGDVIEVNETKEEMCISLHEAKAAYSEHVELMIKTKYFSGLVEHAPVYMMISSIVMWRD